MDARHRWLVPLGLGVVGLVVVANAAGDVGFGSSGRPLELLIACLAYTIAAATFLLWHRAPTTTTAGLLLTVGAAAIATHHGDPDGPVIGLYLVAAFSPIRLDGTLALGVASLATVGFDVLLWTIEPAPIVYTLAVTGGAAAFYLFGSLLRREHEQRSRADALLATLEATRDREARNAALAERSRLAREIHDVLAHTLSGLVLQLEAARMLANNEHPGSQLAATVERAHGLARDGLVEARSAISTLRGTSTPGPDALQTLIDNYRTDTGARCELTIDGDPVPLAPDAAVTLYRAAQESLSNITKHATGAAVDIHLTWRPGSVVLDVTDTGGVPNPHLEPSGNGYGLTAMAERAALLGGTLTATPTATGFHIRLEVPTLHTP